MSDGSPVREGIETYEISDFREIERPTAVLFEKELKLSYFHRLAKVMRPTAVLFKKELKQNNSSNNE